MQTESFPTLQRQALVREWESQAGGKERINLRSSFETCCINWVKLFQFASFCSAFASNAPVINLGASTQEEKCVLPSGKRALVVGAVEELTDLGKVIQRAWDQGKVAVNGPLLKAPQVPH